MKRVLSSLALAAFVLAGAAGAVEAKGPALNWNHMPRSCSQPVGHSPKHCGGWRVTTPVAPKPWPLAY